MPSTRFPADGNVRGARKPCLHRSDALGRLLMVNGQTLQPQPERGMSRGSAHESLPGKEAQQSPEGAATEEESRRLCRARATRTQALWPAGSQHHVEGRARRVGGHQGPSALPALDSVLPEFQAACVLSAPTKLCQWRCHLPFLLSSFSFLQEAFLDFSPRPASRSFAQRSSRYHGADNTAL